MSYDNTEVCVVLIWPLVLVEGVTDLCALFYITRQMHEFVLNLHTYLCLESVTLGVR